MIVASGAREQFDSCFELLEVNVYCFEQFELDDFEFLVFLKGQNGRFSSQNAPQTEVSALEMENSKLEQQE